MAAESDKLVLKMLREIRTVQDQHGRKLDEHSSSLARREKRLDDVARVSHYALGVSTDTQMRQSSMEAKFDALEARPKEIESRV